MTAREYRRMCRIKVTRLSKFITWISLVAFFATAQYFDLSGYVTASISTTIWFYLPDVATYILEHLHKLNHDYVSYR